MEEEKNDSGKTAESDAAKGKGTTENIQRTESPEVKKEDDLVKLGTVTTIVESLSRKSWAEKFGQLAALFSATGGLITAIIAATQISSTQDIQRRLEEKQNELNRNQYWQLENSYISRVYFDTGDSCVNLPFEEKVWAQYADSLGIKTSWSAHDPTKFDSRDRRKALRSIGYCRPPGSMPPMLEKAGN